MLACERKQGKNSPGSERSLAYIFFLGALRGGTPLVPPKAERARRARERPEPHGTKTAGAGAYEFF